MAQGWLAAQVIYQDCGGLPTMIEKGSQAETARALIDQCVAEAVAKTADKRPRVAALLCTHFGFALSLFQDAFRAHGVAVNPVLDPTPRMAAAFLDGAPRGRFDQTTVTVSFPAVKR